MRKALALLVVVLLTAAAAPQVGALAMIRGASAPAEIDEALQAQLAAANPTDRLAVMVHAETSAAAVDAINSEHLALFDTWKAVHVAVGIGTPSAIRALANKEGVVRLEGDRQLEYQMETSHRATRGQDALDGFDGYVMEPQPDLPGPTYQTCRRVKETYRDRRGKRRTRTVRRCTTQQGASIPQPAIRRDVHSDGVDGSGVSIAIVDSGIDGTHPMFIENGKSRVVRNLKLACPAGPFVLQDDACTDESAARGKYGNSRDQLFVDVGAVRNDTDTISAGGHGTHVAGIAAGGRVTMADGKRSLHGAAPGAKLIGLSVGAAIGVVGANSALNWILEHHRQPCGASVPAADCPPIKVVNNSYGPDGGGEYEAGDADSLLTEALVGQGIVMVWAAGNDGGDGSANVNNPPAQSPVPGVLSVANFDDGDTGTRDGQIAPSSSRGKRGVRATYPDVSAPGTDITSACRPTLAICNSVESDQNYGTISGTSMATPHVVGTVAQLIQAGRQQGFELSPAEIEDILEDTAYQFQAGAPYQPELASRNDGTTSFDKGHGLIDVKAAVARIRSMLIDDAGSPPAGAACIADQVVADPRGDTSNSSLDVVDGRMEFNADNSTLTFRIKVRDLTAGYPTAANSIFFNFLFSSEGKQYGVVAQRSQVGGIPPKPEDTVFKLVREVPPSNLENLSSKGMTGSFDIANDEITAVLTQAAIDEANTKLDAAKAPRIAPLTAGTVFTGLGIEASAARNAVAVSAIEGASDTGANACQFVLAEGPQPDQAAPPTDEPAAGQPAGIDPPTNGSATLGDGQSYEAKGAPATVQANYTCSGLGDPKCFTYRIEVQPSTGKGKLSVELSAFEAADYDLYVYDGAGKEVGQGIGLPLTVLEETEVDVTPGVYFVLVQPFTAAPNTPFTMKASLKAT